MAIRTIPNHDGVLPPTYLPGSEAVPFWGAPLLPYINPAGRAATLTWVCPSARSQAVPSLPSRHPLAGRQDFVS